MSTVDRIVMHKINYRIGNRWHKYVMDIFAVNLIADQFGGKWHK